MDTNVTTPSVVTPSLRDKIALIVGLSCFGAIVLTVAIAFAIYVCQRRRAKAKKNAQVDLTTY